MTAPTRRPCRIVVRALDRDRAASIAFDLDARDIAIGRNASAAIRLPHADVALEHARITRTGNGAIAHAYAPGCMVAGRPLESGDARQLSSGDELIVAGRYSLRFYNRAPTDATPTGAHHTTSIARSLARELADVGSARFCLIVERGPAAGATYPIPPGSRQIVGRGPDCEICIVDPDLSRDHAVIAHTPAGIRIGDLNSKNGTYLAGQPIPASELRELRAGDVIDIGGSSLRLYDPVTEYLRTLEAPATDGRPRGHTHTLPRPVITRDPAPASKLVTAVASAIMGCATLALLWVLTA